MQFAMASMERNDDLVIMGQDVAEYGGVFKVTDGFVDKFGKERVRNTPICESGVLSAALGLSVKGVKSVVEMQFADFVSTGFNAVVNNLAKSYWRWGQNADVVVRMPTGAGVGAGPFHSQSNEAWFFHVPGLKIVYPAFPDDAKGLLAASIEDPNPVMYFEHKALYRSVEGAVPDDYYTTEIGKAKLVSTGEDVSIITYGAGVHWALDAITDGTSADILDLRTLLPFDREAIATTVKKTGKVLILHEDTLIGGIGGEIAAWISETLFEYLDAPVMRVASLDTPVPFAIPLENNFLPKERLKEKLKELLSY
jgi:2-oxoisovalerate dehydrogenase E1 component